MTRGPQHRYVFIGGLHRSGTSLVTRIIGNIPGVGSIRDAPVPENEGVYLQGGIPHHAQSGMPMHFATDPDQHLTEHHVLNRLETKLRIEADWDLWFPLGCLWRAEKSSVNLTRMRLLQQLFPMAHFVVVLRHPEAVAAAVSKWIDRPAADLIEHWLDAHDRLRIDLAYLHAVKVLRYEDVTRHPAAAIAGLAAFLDRPPGSESAEPVRNRNGDYADAASMTAGQANRAAVWGYEPHLGVDIHWRHPARHPLRHIRDQAVQPSDPAK